METSDYSATLAPENRQHVISRAMAANPSLIPGGPHGAPVDVGMSALHGEDVASQAHLGLAHDEKPAPERGKA